MAKSCSEQNLEALLLQPKPLAKAVLVAAVEAAVGGDGGENGSDGEDGDDGNGGNGSGFDLGSVKMKQFVLTPGKLGTSSGNHGVGGGGVVVNRKVPSGGNQNYGEGYGGQPLTRGAIL